MQTWILPSELSWLTFSYLSSRPLSNAFLVCKGWHLLINQEAFFKYYARSCSIHELTPGFFLRFFEHFRAEQLFQINSGRITRLDIQGIQETEKNRTSLRVAKLV